MRTYALFDATNLGFFKNLLCVRTDKEEREGGINFSRFCADVFMDGLFRFVRLFEQTYIVLRNLLSKDGFKGTIHLVISFDKQNRSDNIVKQTMLARDNLRKREMKNNAKI